MQIPDDIRAMVWYHGTDSEATFREIVADRRLEPGQTKTGGWLAPVPGRVYLAADPEYSLIYALGGQMMGSKWSAEHIAKTGRYGYIFVVRGEDLGDDIQPDEDAVGEMVGDGDIPWLNELAKRRLTANMLRGIKGGEYIYYAKAGKNLLKVMTDEQKYDLIRRGAAISHAGPVKYRGCYQVDKERSQEFAPITYPKDPAQAATEHAARVEQMWGLVTKVSVPGTGRGYWNLPGAPHVGNPGGRGGSRVRGAKHYGPDDHPGTGTPQSVHGGADSVKPLADRAVAEFGLTNDLREAGYILADGRLLDFSGKREGGPAGKRSYDHRDIGRAFTDAELAALPNDNGASMWAFMQRTGAIRWSLFGSPGRAPITVYVRAGTHITPEQSRVLQRAAGSDYGEFNVIDERGYQVWSDEREPLSRMAMAAMIRKINELADEYDAAQGVKSYPAPHVGNPDHWGGSRPRNAAGAGPAPADRTVAFTRAGLDQGLIDEVLAQYRLSLDSIHGPAHWTRVLHNGLMLAEQTGARKDVVTLFALLHDSQRVDEFENEHGPNAARYAAELWRQGKLKIDRAGFDLLREAMRLHSQNVTQGDVTMRTCWDAERLDLSRPGVGIRVNPRYLATDWGKRPEVIEAAYRRSQAQDDEVDFKHYGPGDHPGTGTPQDVHDGDAATQDMQVDTWQQRTIDRKKRAIRRIPREYRDGFAVGLDLFNDSVIVFGNGEVAAYFGRPEMRAFQKLWNYFDVPLGHDERGLAIMRYRQALGVPKNGPAIFHLAAKEGKDKVGAAVLETLAKIKEFGVAHSDDGNERVFAATSGAKHYGPGDHPGTGTSQDVHGGDGAEESPGFTRGKYLAAFPDGHSAFMSFVRKTGNSSGVLVTLVPQSVKGQQWRRDILPAWRRYVAEIIGEKQAALTGIDADREGRVLFESAQAGKSKHAWIIYEPDLRAFVPVLFEPVGRGQQPVAILPKLQREAKPAKPEPSAGKRLDALPEDHRAFFAYGSWDAAGIPGKENFYITIAPEKLKGHQWHRDIYPALERYIAKAVGRPIAQHEPGSVRGSAKRIITGIDGFTRPEAEEYFANAKRGKTQHAWIVYEPESRAFVPVIFDKSGAKHYGPGNHPSGSPQAVHGGNGDEAGVQNVDGSGNKVPDVVYHGTTAPDFAEFRPGKAHRTMQLGFGIHFSEDENFAREFYAAGKRGRVVRVHLDIQHLLDADRIVYEGTPEFALADKLEKISRRRFPNARDEQGRRMLYLQSALDAVSPAIAERELRAMGYDGVRYQAKVISHDAAPGYYRQHGNATSYVVFEPRQIKILRDAPVPAQKAADPLAADFAEFMQKVEAKDVKDGPGRGYWNRPGEPHRGLRGQRGGSAPRDAATSAAPVSLPADRVDAAGYQGKPFWQMTQAEFCDPYPKAPEGWDVYYTITRGAPDAIRQQGLLKEKSTGYEGPKGALWATVGPTDYSEGGDLVMFKFKHGEPGVEYANHTDRMIWQDIPPADIMATFSYVDWPACIGPIPGDEQKREDVMRARVGKRAHMFYVQSALDAGRPVASAILAAYPHLVKGVHPDLVPGHDNKSYPNLPGAPHEGNPGHHGGSKPRKDAGPAARSSESTWFQDNPAIRPGEEVEGREWLRRNAQTTTAGYRSVAVDIEELLKLPGFYNEHLAIMPERVEGIAASIQREGFWEHSRPLITVLASGRVVIMEGNHRIRAAKRAGMTHIPVEVHYEGGSEMLPDVWDPLRKSGETTAVKGRGRGYWAPHAGREGGTGSSPRGVASAWGAPVKFRQPSDSQIQMWQEKGWRPATEEEKTRALQILDELDPAIKALWRGQLIAPLLAVGSDKYTAYWDGLTIAVDPDLYPGSVQHEFIHHLVAQYSPGLYPGSDLLFTHAAHNPSAQGKVWEDLTMMLSSYDRDEATWVKNLEGIDLLADGREATPEILRQKIARVRMWWQRVEAEKDER